MYVPKFVTNSLLQTGVRELPILPMSYNDFPQEEVRKPLQAFLPFVAIVVRLSYYLGQNLAYVTLQAFQVFVAFAACQTDIGPNDIQFKDKIFFFFFFLYLQLIGTYITIFQS
jgi:hypothetical protein